MEDSVGARSDGGEKGIQNLPLLNESKTSVATLVLETVGEKACQESRV